MAYSTALTAETKAGFYKYELEGLYRGNFYDFKCSFNQNSHISKNFLALTKTAINQINHNPNYKSEIKTSEIILPSYKSDSAIRKKIKDKIKNFYPYEDEDIILVCPDVGRMLPFRNYPENYFIKIVDKLLKHYKYHLILLIGTNETLLTCSSIANEVNDKRCINFCNQTDTLKELVELMGFSKLLIGNDSGPMHFASLTPIKILALFGMESPFVYGPLGRCVSMYNFFHCSPCVSAFNHKNSKCKDNLCLKTISPDKVFDYSLKVINNELKYQTINGNIGYI